MRTFPICPICGGEGHIYKPKRERTVKYKNERPPCEFCNGTGKVSDFRYEAILGKIINGKVECPYCCEWHDVHCGSKDGKKFECKLEEHEDGTDNPVR